MSHDLVDKIIKPAREERHRFSDTKLPSSTWFHGTRCRLTFIVLDSAVQMQLQIYELQFFCEIYHKIQNCKTCTGAYHSAFAWSMADCDIVYSTRHKNPILLTFYVSPGRTTHDGFVWLQVQMNWLLVHSHISTATWSDIMNIIMITLNFRSGRPCHNQHIKVICQKLFWFKDLAQLRVIWGQPGHAA